MTIRTYEALLEWEEMGWETAIIWFGCLGSVACHELPAEAVGVSRDEGL